MRYFYDLIESFELLKKRKLSIKFRRLYEESSELTQKEVQEVQAAAGSEINGIQISLEGGIYYGFDPNAHGGQGQKAPVVEGGQKKKGLSANHMWGVMFPKNGAGAKSQAGVTGATTEPGAPAPVAPESQVEPTLTTEPDLLLPPPLTDKFGKVLPEYLQTAGQAIGMSPYGQLVVDPDTKLTLIGLFEDLAKLLPDLCKNVKGNINTNDMAKAIAVRTNMRQPGEGGSKGEPCGDFFKYFVGGYQASIEAKMAKAVGARYDEEGNLETIKAEVNDDTMIGVGKSLQTIFDILKKENINDTDRLTLRALIKVKGKHLIIKASQEGDLAQHGLVFPEWSQPRSAWQMQGYEMNNMFQSVVETIVDTKSQEDAEEFIISQSVTEGGLDKGDISWRGLHFERVLTALNLHRRCLGAQAQEASPEGLMAEAAEKRAVEADCTTPECRVLCDAADVSWKKFRKEAAKMFKVHHDWVKGFRDGLTAVDEEFYNEYGEAVNALFEMAKVELPGGKAETTEFERVGMLLAKASQKSLMVRMPDAIVTVGTEEGFGKKADTLEAWGSYEEAEAALQRQGVADPSKYIRPMPKKDYLKNEKDAKVAEAIGTGLPDNLFVVGISLKNYEELEETRLAGFSARRTARYIHGDKTETNQHGMKVPLFNQATHNNILEQTGMGPADHKGAQSYQTEIDDLEATVGGLDAVNKVKYKQKTVAIKTLQSRAKAVLKAVADKTQYGDLIDPETDAGQLSVALSRVKNWDSPETSARVKETITKFLLDRKRKRDLENAGRIKEELDLETVKDKDSVDLEKIKELTANHAAAEQKRTDATNHILYETGLISASDDPILGEGRSLADLSIEVYDANEQVFDALRGVKEGRYNIETTRAGNIKIVDVGSKDNFLTVRRGSKSVRGADGSYKKETKLSVFTSRGQVNKHSGQWVEPTAREDASTILIKEFEKSQILLVETLRRLFNQVSI